MTRLDQPIVVKGSEMIVEPLSRVIKGLSGDLHYFTHAIEMIPVFPLNFLDDSIHCSQCSIHVKPVGIDALEKVQYQWKQKTEISRKVRKFYEKQDELIQIFKESCKTEEDRMISIETNNQTKNINLAAKTSFILNLILFTAKLVAAVLSGSFSILSSVVDSAVDLISGIVIWYTNRAIQLANTYRYPIGRKRLEPISVLVLSCIMAMASVLVIRESLGKLISGQIDIDLSYATISIIAGTIVAKFCLFLFCRRIKSPSTQLLALDHRNDVISNALALIFGVLGDYTWSYMDPIGAIILSLYLFISWWQQGSEQIRSLSGHVAPEWLMKEIIWICLQHSTKITGIDTVNASSIGVHYLVEFSIKSMNRSFDLASTVFVKEALPENVHIVLPPETSLSEAHDIGESLQMRLEAHQDIERAFVHVDYDSLHRPSDEHRPVHASS